MNENTHPLKRSERLIFNFKVLLTCFIFTVTSIGLLLLPAFNSMGSYDSDLCALCVGLQAIAVIGAIVFRKRDRSIALGLTAGLVLVILIIPLLVAIWAIYVCQTGPCPPGLSGG